MTTTRVPCVGAIVHDQAGRLLLVRRANPPSAGCWSVPGGRVEPGEEPRAAVRRELREECGLDATQVGPLVGSVEIPDELDPDRVFVVADYRCEVIPDAAPRAGDDATEARFVTLAELDDLDLVPGLRASLAAWNTLPR